VVCAALILQSVVISMALRFKVLLVGAVDVGKTSLLIRFVREEFHDNSAKDVDTVVKTFDVDGQEVSLILPDTAGQERYNTLTTSFFRNADAVVGVYSLVEHESLAAMKTKMSDTQILSRARRCVVGNKCDLLSEDQDQQWQLCKEGSELAESLGIPHYVVSAKTAEGVREMFEEVAADLLCNMDLSRSPPHSEGLKLSPPKKGGKSDCAC